MNNSSGVSVLLAKHKQLQVKAQAAWLRSCNGTLPIYHRDFVSETASHVSECLRLRLAPNRLMSLMQQLLSKADIKSLIKSLN